MTRLLSGSALLWTLGAAAITVYLEIINFGVVDPARDTLSEYVYTEQGARLVGVVDLAAAFAALSLAAALRSAALPGSQPAARLVATWAVAVAILSIFPQEPAEVALTWHGAIHRHAALAGFLALPAAGLLLAAKCRQHPEWQSVTRGLRALSVISLGLLVVFVATFLPLTEPLGARAYSGLVERLLLAANIAVLVVPASRLLRHHHALSAPRAGKTQLSHDQHRSPAEQQLAQR